jgi:hypothetical protein
MERFGEEEQRRMLSVILAANPPEMRPVMIPWIAGSMPLERAARFLGDVQASAPPEVFAVMSAGVRAVVSPRRWDALVKRLPGLASRDAGDGSRA